jgi:chaperone required for assembly of F1-ATPase
MAALDEADQQIAINIDGRTIKFPPSAGEGLKRFVESEMLNPLQTQITELNDRILGNDAIRPIAAE